jgi:hypothetical protein
MSAIIRACSTSTSFKNTGAGSNMFPAATAMVFLLDKNKKFSLSDLNNPDIVTVFTEWIHAELPDKVFPLFGNQIPISLNANTKGTDNTVTLDDGTIVFVSYGQTSKLFSTIDGGLCFAKSLMSFNNADAVVIEIDIKGNIVCKDNKDGTYSGLKATLFAPAIDFADLKNPAKSHFQISYRPDYFLNNAVMLQDGTPLLDLTGLADYHYEESPDNPSTAAGLKIILVDDCCGDDVTDEYAADLVKNKSNFIVADATTGAPVTISTATYAAGVITLAGTFTAGKTYNVDSATSDVLFAGGVEGAQINSGSITV